MRATIASFAGPANNPTTAYASRDSSLAEPVGRFTIALAQAEAIVGRVLELLIREAYPDGFDCVALVTVRGMRARLDRLELLLGLVQLAELDRQRLEDCARRLRQLSIFSDWLRHDAWSLGAQARHPASNALQWDEAGLVAHDDLAERLAECVACQRLLVALLTRLDGAR